MFKPDPVSPRLLPAGRLQPRGLRRRRGLRSGAISQADTRQRLSQLLARVMARHGVRRTKEARDD